MADFLNTFSKLEPCLPEAEIFELLKTALDCVFPLPVDGVSARKNKEEAYKDLLEAEVLMEATMEALHDLIKELLIKNVSPGGLDSIYKVGEGLTYGLLTGSQKATSSSFSLFMVHVSA